MVALIVNCVIFGILYPQVTQFMEMDPNWETYGVVVAINIIITAIFQLISVITLDMILSSKSPYLNLTSGPRRGNFP